MKSITVQVDDDTWRRARERAAQLGTSLTALVHSFLSELDGQYPDDSDEEDRTGVSELERRRSMLNLVLTDFDARGVGLDMSNNLPREALYDRDERR